ncbi:MAG: hypothetical protein WC766_03345 [Patescibacteria group bacterium]
MSTSVEFNQTLEESAMAKFTDPDLLEAFKCARMCLGEDRDRMLMRIAGTVMIKDESAARQFIAEISDPAYKLPVLTRLCEQTLQPEDIQNALRTVNSCSLEDRPDWSAVLRVISLCAIQDWTGAREAYPYIEDYLSYTRALILIARLTDSPEDKAVLKIATDFIQEKLTGGDVGCVMETIGGELIYIAGSTQPYWLAELEWHRKSRTARLARLIDLAVPDFVICTEICMIAETGLVEEALQAFKGRESSLEGGEDQYNHSFAIGYAIQNNLTQAREYAEKIRDPAQRALAFAHLFRTRQYN